ncbi:hypothetical protein EX895_003482 [Sporisorium graminicola]|uniref:Uncharacterized protein n=1 Tax=Sporisorium graminicola TaxID=280036 RepID=A0A4U7KVP7_9BASI|nr:hypothetical protein EX895_003482 [Sporisorium graminicola]TKY87468.1 hypothetical protein EX895_003482 [Sporisorium graminicola]
MCGQGNNQLVSSSSSQRNNAAKEDSKLAKSLSKPPDGSAFDISMAHQIHYACFGNVDVKSYIDARTYGVSFRRLHDEWVVLGMPRIHTSHWPQMVGHRGLPTSPEDFVNVAEYYERKLLEQVLLEAQGKSANRNRPLDEFLVSMVATAAVATADFVIHRLVRDQPSVEESAVQHMWYQSFTAFLRDSTLFYVNERRVCDRLGAHNCVFPLVLGQAHSMSMPQLFESLDYQVQIFKNLFPNFGDHINRCAAARPQQPWPPSIVVTDLQTGSMEAASSQTSRQHDKAREHSSHSSSNEPNSSTPTRTTLIDGTIDTDTTQQQEPGRSRPLMVAVVPTELERRNDLFVASIDPAIRCDVPLERVINLIDTHLQISASTSASSASTPASIATATPGCSAPMSTGLSSGASVPSSESGWQTRRGTQSSEIPKESGDTDIDSASLTLAPPVQSNTWWSRGVPGRSASEEGTMMTPNEALPTHPGRAHSNSAVSYFSSLPSTPTAVFPPGSLMSPQDGTHTYLDQGMYGSRAGVLPMTSTLDADSRKRTRAEQNRDKMKAYHRRVMQQREALTGVLADMAVHVGSVQMTVLQLDGNDTQASAGRIEGSSEASASGSTSRGTQEPNWSVSLRNKQKQESKARLRKREIDQVRELEQYASFASGTLSRSSRSTGGDQGNSATAWQQLQGHQVSDSDMNTTHAILRVFLRHRPNWVALISAEQRLASEVAKLWPTVDEGRMLRGAEGEAVPGDGPDSDKGIKALLDRIQMEDRKGTLAVSAAETTSMVYDPHSHTPRGSAGSSGASSFMATAVAGRARATTLQPFQGQSGHSQTAFMHTTPVVMSPGLSDYSSAVSPSGVTRPAGADESGDYFTQERRRYQGRYSDGSEAGTPLAMSGSTAYNPAEQASTAYATRMPSSGMYRASASGSVVLPPSVLSPSTSSYSYTASYAAGDGPHQYDRHAQTQMSGTSPGQPLPPGENAQLRMSTHYTPAGGYVPSMMQGVPTARMEQGTGLYHSQSLQAPSIVYPSTRGGLPTSHGLQAAGSAPMLQQQQYRSSQPPSPQYPPTSGQQSPYSGNYDGVGDGGR